MGYGNIRTQKSCLYESKKIHNWNISNVQSVDRTVWLLVCHRRCGRFADLKRAKNWRVEQKIDIAYGTIVNFFGGGSYTQISLKFTARVAV